MSDVQTLLTQPTETLASLLVQRDMLNGEIASLSEQRDREEHDAALGREDAEERAAGIRAKIYALTETRGRLQAKIDQRQAEQDDAERDRLRAQAAELPRQIVRAVKRQIELAETAQRAGDELGRACRELQKNGQLITELVETSVSARLRQGSVSPGLRERLHHVKDETKRLFSLGPLRIRLQCAFFHTFDCIPVEHREPGTPAVSFFPFDAPIKGHAHLTKTMPQRELEAFDDIPIDIFDNREDAEASRLRRDPSGRGLHVKQEGDMYRVVAGELRGQAASQNGGRP